MGPVLLDVTDILIYKVVQQLPEFVRLVVVIFEGSAPASRLVTQCLTRITTTHGRLTQFIITTQSVA